MATTSKQITMATTVEDGVITKILGVSLLPQDSSACLYLSELAEVWRSHRIRLTANSYVSLSRQCLLTLQLDLKEIIIQPECSNINPDCSVSSDTPFTTMSEC